jgi:hypothetical protein
MLEFERGSSMSHFLENSFLKWVRACRKTDCVMNKPYSRSCTKAQQCYQWKLNILSFFKAEIISGHLPKCKENKTNYIKKSQLRNCCYWARNIRVITSRRITCTETCSEHWGIRNAKFSVGILCKVSAKYEVFWGLIYTGGRTGEKYKYNRLSFNSIP